MWHIPMKNVGFVTVNYCNNYYLFYYRQQQARLSYVQMGSYNTALFRAVNTG